MEKKSIQQVTEFLTECALKGFHVTFRNTIVTISKNFPVGDSRAFTEIDMVAPQILRKIPVRKSDSSMWGTDGGSVGGAAAMEYGFFILNISGVQKRFLAELEKHLKPIVWTMEELTKS